MFHSGEVADMGNRPGPKNVAAQFPAVPLANKNAAIAPKWTSADVFCNALWSSVIVTNFINRAYSVDPRGKVQRRDMQLRINFQIAWRGYSFARRDHTRMTAASTGRK